MKFVNEALRNKHKGDPVWVMGADPTVVTYPKDFLSDKLSIVIGSAQRIFQNGTYNYNNESRTILPHAKLIPDYLAKAQLWAFPFYGKDEDQSRALIERLQPVEAWYLDYKPYPPRGHRPDALTDVGRDAMIALVGAAHRGEAGPYGGFGTCLHCALYVAIIMGCDPINIVCCSHRVIGDHWKPPELGGRPMTPEQIAHSEKNWCRYAEGGTQAIMEGCRREGIEVIRWQQQPQ